MANIVTAKEVGRFLKLTESTIYKLASTGELPGFKIGDSWRFDMDEILKLIRGAKKGSNKRERITNSTEVSENGRDDKDNGSGSKEYS